MKVETIRDLTDIISQYALSPDSRVTTSEANDGIDVEIVGVNTKLEIQFPSVNAFAEAVSEHAEDIENTVDYFYDELSNYFDQLDKDMPDPIVEAVHDSTHSIRSKTFPTTSGTISLPVSLLAHLIIAVRVKTADLNQQIDEITMTD